jgi:hypothetical protein
MNKLLRLGMLGSLAVAAALALSTGPAMAATPAGHPDGSQHHKGYVCTGGEIPSGTYDSLTVTGTCAVAADAVIRVDGNVTVRADATSSMRKAHPRRSSSKATSPRQRLVARSGVPARLRLQDRPSVHR